MVATEMGEMKYIVAGIILLLAYPANAETLLKMANQTPWEVAQSCPIGESPRSCGGGVTMCVDWQTSCCPNGNGGHTWCSYGCAGARAGCKNKDGSE
jgi:hypothetical protein